MERHRLIKLRNAFLSYRCDGGKGVLQIQPGHVTVVVDDWTEQTTGGGSGGGIQLSQPPLVIAVASVGAAPCRGRGRGGRPSMAVHRPIDPIVD